MECTAERAVSLCTHCNSRVCTGCKLLHLDAMVFGKLMKIGQFQSGAMIRSADDLKKRLGRVDKSIQSAKTEINEKVQKHILAMEKCRQLSVTRLEQRSTKVKERLSNLDELSSSVKFYRDTTMLLFESHSEKDLVPIDEQCDRLIHLFSQNLTTDDLSSDVTLNLRDAQLSKVIDDYCSVEFTAPTDIGFDDASSNAHARDVDIRAPIDFSPGSEISIMLKDLTVTYSRR